VVITLLGAPSTIPVTRVQLLPYTLSYDFVQSRIPQDSEVKEVTDLTSAYLERFFEPRIETLDALDTVFRSSDFRLLQPFKMNYTSDAVFLPDVTNVPPADELNMILSAAFAGSNLAMYLSLIQGLSVNNVFQTTKEVVFTVGEQTVRAATTDPRRKSGGPQPHSKTVKTRVGIGAAMSAGAVALTFLALFGSRHLRKDGKEQQEEGKPLAGHVTVGDDTYRGDSTIFSGEVRQTRFSAVDEIHSIASKSEWGLPRTQDTLSDFDERSRFYDEEASGKPGLLDEISESGEDSLAQNHSLSMPSHNYTSVTACGKDELSVDEDVPLRVVDLIKRFTTTTRAPSGR
jgi:hypothetical protein